MIRKKNQPGCPCCSGPCTWVVTVRDCLAVRSGVLVTVTQGASTYTATTNGSGIATFTGLATGSATATTLPPNTRFNAGTATRTLVAGSQSDTITMPAASGYACAGSFGCADPIPTTLSGTYWRGAFVSELPADTVGVALTFTYSGGFWLSNWFQYRVDIDPASVMRIRLAGSVTPNKRIDQDDDGDGSFTTTNVSTLTASTCNPFLVDNRSFFGGFATPDAGSLYVTE